MPLPNGRPALPAAALRLKDYSLTRIASGEFVAKAAVAIVLPEGYGAGVPLSSTAPPHPCAQPRQAAAAASAICGARPV